MPLRDVLKKARHDRFDRFNIVVSILLAGWVPSIVILFVSYTVLGPRLESKILRDRQTFVQLISRLVGDDLSRTQGIIDYYQTLPDVSRILNSSNQQSAAQQWIGTTFYSHPRIDGMFLTGRDGRLIGSIPYNPAMIGKDLDSNLWRPEADKTSVAFVSPVHPRFSDKRIVTDIVGAVRTPDKNIAGYLGVSVLVERIGRRLSTIQFADQSTCQVIDQTRQPLFTNDFRPNPGTSSGAESIVPREISETRNGNLELAGNLYSFSPVESTGWTVVVRQPKAVAYKPVHDLTGNMAVLAGLLMALAAIFAWLGGIFYRRQMEAARRIEREVIFSEKILANMPVGIAFVDPTSKKFLQANEAFSQMAQRFGGLSQNREIVGATYNDVKIAPVDAIERVLSFGTPFQLIEQSFRDEGDMTHFVNVTLLRLQAADQTIQGVLYLIEDLLDVTRIAKGKLQLSFEVVDVHEILRRAYEICREDLAKKSIEVKFELDAQGVHVEGDPARLQQVFWNLVKNSVKFTPANGRITVATSNIPPDEIEVRISDTGIGIEPEKVEKIFNAFEQGQTSITRRFGGLGLGLAISKAMVDAHRGKIHVESPGKDKGSTFVVQLKTVAAPVRAENGADGERPTVPDKKKPISRRHRLLVVDDHADTCTGMKMMLERRGYDITVAYSAGAALEKTEKEDFDLLISDIRLPHRSGYELMSELRKSKGLPGIALSGFGMETDVNKAREAGFSEHLTKPINFDRLEQAIRHLLESTS